jgi:hypothetical protein
LSAISHKFVFESVKRARLFVRQVFANCETVATFRDETVVIVIDGHDPPQTEKLAKMAQSNLSTPLPSRISRLPTMVEIEPVEVDVEPDPDDPDHDESV